MENAKELWNKTQVALKEMFDESTYNATFGSIKEVYKFHNGYIFLKIENLLNKYRIEKFYLEKMNSILATFVTAPTKFKLITTEDANKEEENASKTPFILPDTPEKFKSRTLKPEYTFDNFVTGEANREAFTFSIKVADSPHVTVNPLYIFGDVGFGKTHLMTAIGHYILDNNISANIVFTSAQQFVEDYFDASRSPEAADQFKHFYRSADVLLVDDIQLLKDKIKTQEEFFKLFEYLHENNKQIVITSDRPASELEIMDRLKSRFSWGIPVDIKKPNFDLRLSILSKKLKFLINDPSVVSQEALAYIAENFDKNVRELEGALRRFVSYCVAFNIDFSYDSAKEVLSSLVSKEKVSTENYNSAIIDKIKIVVANYYNVNVKELSSNSRKQDLVLARMITVYLLRSILNLQLKKIGECLGGRDHATIAHSINKIEALVNSDSMIKQDIDVLTKKIKEN